MARTRAAPRRRPNNNFNNRRFAAAKEIANARERRRNHERRSKNVEVKHRGNVLRRMRIRRKAIFPATVRKSDILETNIFLAKYKH